MFASVTFITVALACSALGQFHPIRAPVPTIARTEVRDDHGQVSLSYSTGDGLARSQYDILVPGSNGDFVPRQTGQVAYTSPEGIPVSFSYIADENGFRAEGTHIPKQPPPVPIR